MGKLDEVVYLVEWPVVLEGKFDERYLELPERIPITAMQSHQRYFPLVREGRLEARFAFVANGGDPAVVVRGNEEVLVGRLQDAAFALEKDMARGLDAMLAELGRVSFLEGGGSLADKSERVHEVAGQLCERVESEPGTRDAVLRAAELCKADIVSALVAEFSDLQGYAGSVYARHAGESDAVCDAIDQHHSRWRREASCPPARPAPCSRSPTRPTRSRSPLRLARSRPAAAIRTACAAPRPASSRSRWRAGSSWDSVS